jgi:protein-tyrosine phosphatase
VTAVPQRPGDDPLGCCNFRDLGGHRVPGGVLHRGRLYRSDSLVSASAAQRTELVALRLATVLDLRTPHEAARGGRYTASAVDYYNLPLGDPVAEMTSTGWASPEHVATRYFEFLVESEASVRKAFAVLTHHEAYPTVIHCSLGKDRTGILVALVLSLIGVDDDGVAADYALSGLGTARLALHLRELCHGDLGELNPFLPALLWSDPDTIRWFLAMVRASFGSLEGYTDHIGAANCGTAMRVALVEPSSALS